jgi:PKD repeat protein
MSRGRVLSAVVGTVALAAAAVPGFSATELAVEEPAVRFTASGDFAANPNTSAVLNAIRTPGNDLTLALGDLSYGVTGTEQSWCDFVTSRVGAGYPFELLAGNHESNGQNGNINDFSACLPNQLPGVVGTYGRQYYVDVPAEAPLVRYIMISPGIQFPDGLWSYNAGTTRHAWTADTIDSARSAGIPWVVVGMHKPCLSVGEYGCDPGSDIMNLLVSKRVDLVLSGHEHHYARTAQLAQGPGCANLTPGAFTAACVADSDTAMAKGAGTVFGTVGTGGTALRQIHTDDTEFGYFAATSGAGRQPAHGFLQVSADADRLEGSFVPVNGTFQDTFTITRGEQNLPPTASFTAETDDLTVDVDATDSVDTDGSIASYAWDFGDGGTGSGVTATHTYETPGDHQVVLTVTDDDGATASATRTVTVTEPTTGPAPVATDAFQRTATGQWGTADLGGQWSLAGGTANFTVGDGVGYIRMASSGAAPATFLSGIGRTDTEVRVEVGQDKPPTGFGTSARVQPRRLPNGDGYFAAVRFVPNGTVNVTLVRLVGTQTKLANVIVPGLTHQPGDTFHVRAQTTGSSPTTIRTKVWKVGTPEPSEWTATATDSTAGLQGPGDIGLRAELGTGSTNAPVRASFDNLWVGPTG